MFRFGLRDNPTCDYCNEIETVNHKLTECLRTVNLRNKLENKIRPLRVTNFNYEENDDVSRLLAAHTNLDLTSLTLHAELLHYLMINSKIPEDILIDLIIMNVLKLERNEKIKNDIRSLL